MASRVTKAAPVVVDFARIQHTYGLGKETLSALSAFRKRATDAAVQNSLLSEANKAGKVDFAAYRAILKNTAIIDEIEKSVKAFQPVQQDISADLKAIDAFEGKAVELATATVTKIEEAVVDLKQDLKNVEECRPLEELTLQDVLTAVPEIQDTVDIAMSNARFDPPGYYQKFPSYSIL